MEATRGVLQALPPGALLFSVSGTDDFAEGTVSHRSAFFAGDPQGFARIGLRVRAELLASQRPFASIHLGTVYGPGKLFASKLFPGLAKGRLPVIGNGRNRLPLVHVEDVARALVHLTTLSREQLIAHPVDRHGRHGYDAARVARARSQATAWSATEVRAALGRRSGCR